MYRRSGNGDWPEDNQGASLFHLLGGKQQPASFVFKIVYHYAPIYTCLAPSFNTLFFWNVSFSFTVSFCSYFSRNNWWNDKTFLERLSFSLNSSIFYVYTSFHHKRGLITSFCVRVFTAIHLANFSFFLKKSNIFFNVKLL